MLESKTKFFVTNPRKDEAISPSAFFEWTSGHHYRTSYNDMSNKQPVDRKSSAIPGYKGYVPSVKAENMFGRPYTTVTREIFRKDKLDDKPNLYATTGFNWTTIDKADQTMHATCHKYGRQTIPLTHPHIRCASMSTTTRDSFLNPKRLPNPVWRIGNSHEEDESTASTRPLTKASGFIANSTLLDGTGWVPEKVLHSDMVRTEYRNRFNQPKPFHKVTVRVNDGRLKRRSLVYDKE